MPDECCNKRLSELEKHHAETLVYRRLREESERDAQERSDKVINQVNADLTEIKEFMNQQKSFIGAVVFIVGGMYAVIALFADKILK